MRYFPTIFLAVSALVLATLATIYTGGKYHDEIFGVPAIEKEAKLFDIKELDKVRKITLSNNNITTVFKAKGNVWMAEKPWKDRIDPLFVRALFQFTSELKVQEIIPRNEVKLKDFGLRKEKIKVTMHDAHGKKIYSYSIGKPAAWKIPVENGKHYLSTTFIRISNKSLKHNIYLCSTESGLIHSLFNNDFERFRDHHPFYFSHHYLDKVKIQNKEGEVIISRDSLRSPWRISKPLELSVDPEALSNVFTNLAKLRAIKVEDRSNVTLPTSEDEASHTKEISIHSDGLEKDFILSIYPPLNENDTTTLATVNNRPNTVFHLPVTSLDAHSSSLSQLQTGVNDLRSKTMTHLNGPQLKNIIIRPTGRPSTSLRRSKKTTWRVLRGEGYQEANAYSVISLMTAVTRDKVKKFVSDAATDLSPYGLQNPFLRIAFISFNDEAMALAFGKDAKGEHIYAHVIGKPNIWEITPETLGKISINPWQWRTAHVWNIPKMDIKNINLQKKGKLTANLQYDFFTEKWTASRGNKDATATLNPNRANKFLTNIADLSTERWIGPHHPQAMKMLKKPDTVIKISMQPIDDDGKALPLVTKTLRIANTKGHLIYFAKVNTTPKAAGNEGEENYFLLDKDTITKLYVNLFQ